MAQRIRARRLATGMSQTTLGQRVGVTFQQIQKYEKGSNRVGAGRLQCIAEVLGVPVTFFFPESKQSDVDLSMSVALEFMTTARAVRLMRAYSRIIDSTVQHAIVDLVEKIADQR